MFTMSRYRLCFLHLFVVFTMKDVEVCEEVARYINVYVYKQLSENYKGNRHFGSVYTKRHLWSLLVVFTKMIWYKFLK